MESTADAIHYISLIFPTYGYVYTWQRQNRLHSGVSGQILLSYVHSPDSIPIPLLFLTFHDSICFIISIILCFIFDVYLISDVVYPVHSLTLFAIKTWRKHVNGFLDWQESKLCIAFISSNSLFSIIIRQCIAFSPAANFVNNPLSIERPGIGVILIYMFFEGIVYFLLILFIEVNGIIAVVWFNVSFLNTVAQFLTPE